MRWTEQQLAEYESKRAQMAQADDTPDEGKESVLLNKCLKWCRKWGYPVFHDYSKNINEPGWMDLFIYLPDGRHVLIELKAKNGRHSKEQNAKAKMLMFLGHEVHKKVQSYKRFLEIMQTGSQDAQD